MDYAPAIERYRKQLLLVVALLFTMIGLTDAVSIERLRRPLYCKLLSRLRPAEAAVRRLIIVMAQGIVIEPQAERAASTKRSKSRQRKSKSKTRSRRSFPLFDPLLRAGCGFRHPRPTVPQAEPRIRWLGSDPLVPWFARPMLNQPQPASPPPPPEPDDTVSARSVCRRLAAIKDALQDLQRQAMRYARWRDKPSAERRPQRETALRRGRPPGLREKSSHEVHEVLKECQWLVHTLPNLNTS